MPDTLLTLLTEIRTGNIVLPDIQRSFIWTEEQIYAFYDSLFRGYPIGSLLLWKAIGSEDPKDVILYHRFVHEYELGMKIPKQAELKSGESKTLVLDGQQRLQSLYIGAEGIYEGRDLYLDLLSTRNKNEGDETHYFVRFLNAKELEAFRQRNKNRRMIRIKDFIRLPPERFLKYRTTFLEKDFGLIPGTEEYETGRDVLDQARYTFAWEGRVPIVKIDEGASTFEECKSLDEVAEIFVRVNDGGTKLSRMDLIFSLMKSKWTDASEEIENLCSVLNSKGEFGVDKDFIIRCLMVFSGRSVKYEVSQIRRSELMENFREIFPKAKASILSTFDFLTENRGGAIRTWRLLSGGQRADRGYNVVIPIALYLYGRSTQEIPEIEYRRMRRYLYAAILSRFTVIYVETRLNQLISEIRANSKDTFPAEACINLMRRAENFNNPEELIGRPHTLDPLLNILNGGSVDFSTLLDRNAPQRDHIFPQSRLREKGIPEYKINHYANMRLLGAINNILKSAQDPQNALASYDAKVLADDYLIPKEFLSYDQYDDFIKKRAELIQHRIAQFLSDSQISS